MLLITKFKQHILGQNYSWILLTLAEDKTGQLEEHFQEKDLGRDYNRQDAQIVKAGKSSSNVAQTDLVCLESDLARPGYEKGSKPLKEVNLSYKLLHSGLPQALRYTNKRHTSDLMQALFH